MAWYDEYLQRGSDGARRAALGRRSRGHRAGRLGGARQGVGVSREFALELSRRVLGLAQDAADGLDLDIPVGHD